MTILDWGLLGVFLLSLLFLVIIVLRKIPKLIIIDLATIAKEREARVRERLLRERIRRQFAYFFQWRPIHALTHRMDRFAHYLEANGHVAVPAAREDTQDVKVLLEQALIALRQKQYAVAEERALAVVRHAPQHATAYAVLGRAKLAQHAYRDARDALQFAVRRIEKEAASGFISEREEEDVEQHMRHVDDRELALLRYDLSMALKEEGDTQAALEQLEGAVLVLPNDPKVLDALLSLSILVQKKELAKETLEQLRTANPDNEKLAEFSERVAALQQVKKKKKVVPL